MTNLLDQLRERVDDQAWTLILDLEMRAGLEVMTGVQIGLELGDTSIEYPDVMLALLAALQGGGARDHCAQDGLHRRGVAGQQRQRGARAHVQPRVPQPPRQDGDVAPLGPEVIRLVADKMLGELELQLADRDVHIEYTEAARQWVAEKGYDKLFGARPMARLIDEKIKEALVDELLFGKLEHGGTVKVDVDAEGTARAGG